MFVFQLLVLPHTASSKINNLCTIEMMFRLNWLFVC